MRLDATRVVFGIRRQADIDLPTDGKLYRFDIDHPDTKGMIEYFVQPMAGMQARLGRADCDAYSCIRRVGFPNQPAAPSPTAKSPPWSRAATAT